MNGKFSYPFNIFVILIVWCFLTTEVVDASVKDPVYSIVSSKLCNPNVKQYSGYIKIDPFTNLFFWFFESRNNPKDSPFTLWVAGGPGCTSMAGLWQQVGPCRVTLEDDVKINPESWNEVSNILFVDQPVGSGFSFGKKIVSTTEQSALGLYAFLQKFFERFPEYSKMDFYIFGESYAGFYIPSLARLIDENNILINSKYMRAIPINLKSVGIGNGWIDPKVISDSYADFAEFNTYGSKLNPSELATMRSLASECDRSLNTCRKSENVTDCGLAGTNCLNIADYFSSQSGLNQQDVRTTINVTYDFISFLSKPEVMKSIGAKILPTNCSDDIFERFTLQGDVAQNHKPDVEYLLHRGFPVLLYHGDADLLCNWFGGLKLAESLIWPFKSEFNKAPMKKWRVGNSFAGETKSFNKLTFVRVYGAGHSVPYYQPKNSLDMFTKWINNEALTTEKKEENK